MYVCVGKRERKKPPQTEQIQTFALRKKLDPRNCTKRERERERDRERDRDRDRERVEKRKKERKKKSEETPKSHSPTDN